MVAVADAADVGHFARTQADIVGDLLELIDALAVDRQNPIARKHSEPLRRRSGDHLRDDGRRLRYAIGHEEARKDEDGEKEIACRPRQPDDRLLPQLLCLTPDRKTVGKGKRGYVL